MSVEISHKRIEELDFFKSLFILLMIAFHLVYIGDGYPYLKKFVYTFHMPGFLLISGYLMNVNKTARDFGKTLWWLAIPYIVMEAGYVGMASVLPIRDHISQLSCSVLLERLLIHPLGPYWYLHSLIVFGIWYFIIFKWTKCSILSRLILIGLSYYAMAQLGLVSLPCALYFLAGIAVRQSAHTFTEVFRPSWVAFVGLLILFFQPNTFDKATFGGILIVYFVFSASLAVYPYLPIMLKKYLLFLGRNSLALYLFSPMFTIGCKILVPYLAFDPTRLLFLGVSLLFCVFGCLLVCKILDWIRISPLMFGRRHILF